MDWIQPADKQPLLADLDTGIRRVLADHAHLAVDVDSVDENGLSQHRCGQVWGESGTWSSCGR